MTAERPVLTKEQVTEAESRVGFSHPVLTVIESHRSKLVQLSEAYPKTTPDGQHQYIRENYGFLADALVEAGPYTIEPLDLIAIWSLATTGLFPNYARYRLAEMVSGAYAIQGTENPEWRKFPRYTLEINELPEGVKRDKNELIYVQNRLDQVYANLDEIQFYIYGSRESSMHHVFILAKRSAEGDEAAKKELDALTLNEQMHKTPVLNELMENFGPARRLNLLIDAALKTLQG